MNRTIYAQLCLRRSRRGKAAATLSSIDPNLSDTHSPSPPPAHHVSPPRPLFPVFVRPRAASGLLAISTASGDTAAPVATGPAIESGPPYRAPSHTEPTISAEHLQAPSDESEDSESDGASVRTSPTCLPSVLP